MNPIFAAVMSRVIESAQSKPATVSVAGAVSGFFAWLITRGEEIRLIFQIIGGFVGMLLALISLVLVLPKCIRFYRAWRAKGFDQADRDSSA